MGEITTAEVTRFFDEFVEAFATFDGAVVAARYAAPFLAVDATGASKVLPSADDIGRYFQSFLDDYRAGGTKACRYRDLEVAAIGTGSVLATVTWELMRPDGTLSQSWRESYILAAKGAGLRVLASIDHAD